MTGDEMPRRAKGVAAVCRRCPSGELARVESRLHQVTRDSGRPFVVERSLAGLNRVAVLPEMLDAIRAEGQVLVEARATARDWTPSALRLAKLLNS